ncbi:metalloregulator ArsR/SmtB family transcription factor [Chloroflexi bacterium TSY]|nr:metalloregulator ArsR/SmtB family transcription factor [Chloroflexi bacterium TSY]
MLLDHTFQALANPTRRQILTHLTTGQSTVLEIAEQFEMSLNGVSKHLKILEQAGLIHRDIQGRTHYCSLKPEGLEQASEWIEYHRRFWENRIDALEQFLEDKKAKLDEAS